MQFPSEIPFSAFLQYSPRGQSQTSRLSQEVMRAIKNDSVLPGPGQQRAIPYAAHRLAQEMVKHPVLEDTFSPDVVLVPVPRSAPLVTGGLWPALKICQAIEDEGIAGQVLPMVIRQKAVPKSATASQGKRPGPETHYDSLTLEPNRPLISPTQTFVIVDDVVTRGATFFGCYARLREDFPNAQIKCFGLIRTVSGHEVDALLLPVGGVITYKNGHIHREP